MAMFWILSMFLIKISSFLSLWILKEMAREMDRGRPSGIATIKMTTAMIPI
jgi:hypothetical protein